MTTEHPRFQVNRALVVLRYKQPYIDWVKIAGEFPIELTLEEANDDSEAFLVPSFDSQMDPVDGTEDAVKWVEKRWRMLFEHILVSWTEDESEWPQKRTLIMFREWFDVEYRSIVWDMGNEPLMIDDFEAELDDELSGTGVMLH